MNVRILYLLVISLLLACNPHYTKKKTEYTHYSLQTEKEHEVIKSAIAPYAEKVKTETEKVIAISTEVLTKDMPQSPLGNFMCDAMKFSAQTEFKENTCDLVLCNRGGIRSTLPKGEIKVNNIFEVMPFDNELVMLTISGEKLLQGLKTIIGKFHPYLGLQLEIKNGEITEALINGEIIDKEKNYNIVTSDYIANGGDSFTFLKNPISTKRCNLKIRESMINYCIYLTEIGKQIIPYTDDRLKISK